MNIAIGIIAAVLFVSICIYTLREDQSDDWYREDGK